MIYSAAFRGLPPEMKTRVMARLRQALDPAKPDPQFAYLAVMERQTIRRILKETLVGLPQDW